MSNNERTRAAMREDEWHLVASPEAYAEVRQLARAITELTGQVISVSVWEPCEYCDGLGFYALMHPDGHMTKQTCWKCGGTGKRDSDEQRKAGGDA